MEQAKLFMMLLGCRPPGRHTEQHDVFFSIGTSIKELVPQIKKFWTGAGPLHIDAWREVNWVNGFEVRVLPLSENTAAPSDNSPALFFINLGGYKAGEFEEFHYKMLAVATHKREAIKQVKKTAFYKHTGFKGAPSHIDDKYGIDVDDLYQIEDILPAEVKKQYRIQLSPSVLANEDVLHLGYFKLSSFK
jgi:hypothetical protein